MNRPERMRSPSIFTVTARQLKLDIQIGRVSCGNALWVPDLGVGRTGRLLDLVSNHSFLWTPRVPLGGINAGGTCDSMIAGSSVATSRASVGLQLKNIASRQLCDEFAVQPHGDTLTLLAGAAEAVPQSGPHSVRSEDCLCGGGTSGGEYNHCWLSSYPVRQHGGTSWSSNEQIRLPRLFRRRCYTRYHRG